jgi:hypothetical protein
MLRAPLAAAVALSASVLALSGTARADDCMCVVVELSWGDVAPHFEPQAHFEPHQQSIEVGPFFSSDGTLLTSHAVASRGASAPSRSRAPVQDVLWCASSDDPRCSPGDPAPEDGPRAGDATHAAATQAQDIDLRAQPPRSLGPTHLGANPSRGVRGRLDRPPQR